MSNINPPTRILGVCLLHKCNFNCPHCGYLYTGDSDDHEIKPGYRLTWDQILRLIADCKSIENERFGFVLNGGEPTLWEEGELKLIDILLLSAEEGIIPSFNTNGSYFVDYNQCRDFFNQYAEEGKIPLMTAVSIDKFHGNYNREKGRADSLDNIVKVLSKMPAEKRDMHSIHVISIVSNDPDSYLPVEMTEYYKGKGITFGEYPMQPIGRAKNLMDEMPDTEEFFKSLPPEKGPGEMPIATLIGENFIKIGKNLGTLGHLKDLVKQIQNSKIKNQD